ncbi:MAG: hypothetical protein KIB43_03190 [Clostridium baratii]|uniref:hypothetical protein n=1 Tax=Clostridium baratii TaxID=1561 RepID=UPI0006C15871|nr:hypothetical protein [Clostridium baratii]MBS6005940.1 hypothetical protein [Clostridium baratii]MDU4911686.1 hypothetical protein [Clostridium baratii]CUP18100.1 Uncharacterised protein [Clostridium baratii]
MRGVKLFLLSLCSIFLIIGCNSSNNKLPEKRPEDFSFVLRYGIQAKNQIDTFKSTYIKDMVNEDSKEINLKLSDKDMDEIYSIMKDINILEYPDVFKPKSETSSKPYEEFYLKVLVNGKEKVIEWPEDNNSQSDEAIKLRKLFRRIHEIISTKEEYKNLPDTKSGYN